MPRLRNGHKGNYNTTPPNVLLLTAFFSHIISPPPRPRAVRSMTPPSDCCHHAFYRAMPRIAPTQDIRPSHAGIVPKQINKSNFFPPSGGHTILVFSCETLWQYSDNGEPPNGDVDCNGYEKSRFLTNISLYLGNDTR